EGLERRDVGVLDAMEPRQSFGGGLDVRAEVAGPFLDGWPESSDEARWGLDEQPLASLLIRKQLEKIDLRHHQFALQNTGAEGRDQTEPYGLPAAIDHDIVAQILVQDVGHRVCVRDDGHDATLIAR